MTPNMFRLSVMMFLQFFVWGAWYVSMTGFINKANMADLTGAAYTVGPIAAIIAPFFLGLVADRFFASERVLGVLHIIGGVLVIMAPSVAKPFHLPEMPADASLLYKVMFHDLSAYVQPFTLLLLAHMLCYMPTLALTTSLSFQNLKSQEKQFPVVRVLGTIGWIVGNIAVGYLPDKDESATQFIMAGGAAILLGLYSFTLPHTPPPAKGKSTSIGQILGIDSFKMFRSPAYIVFIVCSFLLCIPLAGYYQQARNYVSDSKAYFGAQTTPEKPADQAATSDASNASESPVASPTFTISFGQMSEIFFMLVMPWFFVRLGVKNMLAIGMAAWFVRYGLFAVAAENKIFWMILLGVLLHGVCYDFFFVTGMIYADKKASKDIRAQAQGFLVLVTQGLGLGLGAKLFFAHVMMNTHGKTADWHTIWLYPAIFAAAILVIFYAFFWDHSGDK